MKSALLATSAAVALVLGFGLTASVAAQQAAGPGPVPLQQPAGAPQDARAAVVTPDGSQQRSAPVQREQVTLRDGATVTVLRPVMARGEQASGQEEDVVAAERAGRPAWQVAAGGRLWAIDPATNELRTCAVHQTSTVGLKVLRCVDTSWK
jgi:hypothetical protein